MRFSSFSDEWTTSLLKDSASFYKGTGISKEELSEEGHPCILYGELYTTYKTEKIKDVKSKTSLPTEKLVKSKANDVIIPASGETPIDIATACCIMNDDILLGGDLNIIRIKKHNGVFLSCQLNGKRKLDIAKIAQGASIVHLHNDDLKKLKCCYPKTLCEEEKIVAFLSKIDERISTQSKIIDKLKSQIISISNTMVKSIAKKISIEEICDFEEKTKHQSGDGLASGTYPFFTNEEETVKFFDSYDFNGEYIIANTGGKANFKYYNGKFAVMSDCLVIKFKSPKLTNFYSIVLSTLQKYINYVGFEGSGLKHLNKDWLLKLQVPQYGSEAETFIKIIDELKEKLQKEKDILSLYKKQKAYLLANMFI